MIDLTRDGEVFVLTMHDGENRLSPPMLDALDAALTEVAEAEGPRALVTTGSDRFYSNGLDLDWLGDHPDEMLPYLGRVHALFARILSMPCATVAACNGHTFAAGAMLAIAHDVRVMRSDRGYWCLPEVDLGMPFTPGMNALIPARLPAMTAHEAMVTGRRYTGRHGGGRHRGASRSRGRGGARRGGGGPAAGRQGRAGHRHHPHHAARPVLAALAGEG
ncbi:MAG: enoyl-CoA hydratase/isomerase family protein [Acidimicrobiales bacterium]